MADVKKTILIRGGSIASGYGVTKAYPDMIAEALASSGIQIINRSRYRETSFNGIWALDEDILQIRPDILILNFGVDDAFFPVYRSEFQENHVQIIRKAKALFNPRILLATSHTFDDVYEMDAVNIYYRSLMIVAKDLECELVPIHLLWAGYVYENGITSASLTLNDSRYPNEEGHRIFADAIITHLNQ